MTSVRALASWWRGEAGRAWDAFVGRRVEKRVASAHRPRTVDVYLDFGRAVVCCLSGADEDVVVLPEVLVSDL